MTAQEAISFIHERFWRGSIPGLSRTRQLLSLLGSPQEELKIIHVAGTNGKGSTSAMLSGILTAAGYKTGLFTSPFITSFNERIQINGLNIDDAALAEVSERVFPLALSMEDKPTEFELITAIAFEYFRNEGCELVVLETGMGGRLDSTNVISRPLLSIITNIGLDHTAELGGTIEEIAAEKAGIIKPQCPTVIYDLPDNARRVIAEACKSVRSELYAADFGQLRSISDSILGQVFSYKGFSELPLSLLGAHQLKNAALALEAVMLLRAQGLEITDESVACGLKSARWPARFELVSESPLVIVDGGHNPQCAETVSENLRRYFPEKKVIFLLGVLADKDYMGMARALDSAAGCFVTVTPDSPRALSSQDLANAIKALGKPVFACADVDEGIKKALQLTDSGSLICSVGSLYFAGTVRQYFGKR